MNILVVDDEEDIVEILSFLLQSKLKCKVTTFLANSANEAIEVLKNNEIHMCISDHNMPNGNGNTILDFIIKEKMQAKFILSSTIVAKDIPELYPADKVYFQIIKPEIVPWVTQLATLINDRELNSTDSKTPHYIPITLQFLLILKKIPADIYIKISDDKYIKCHNEGDQFNKEDHSKYFNKQVLKLFIKNPKDIDFLNSKITQVLSTIMNDQNLSIDEKLSFSHDQLIELARFTGITTELSNQIKTNIDETIKLISKNESFESFWLKLKKLGNFPSDLYSLQIIIASSLLKKLSWGSAATIYKITLSSFLQDIHLTDLALIKIRDVYHFNLIKESLTDKQISEFLDHPQKAKESIVNFKEIPPDIDKLILEQHEAPDGTGFPRKTSATKLSPMSCLFILSRLVALDILIKGDNFSLKQFITDIEVLGYDKGNFREIFNLLSKL